MHRFLPPTAVGIVGLLSLSGCFLDRTALGDLDAGEPPDGGAIDAGLDARVAPGDAIISDAIIPDAVTPDAEPGCTRADEHCAGNVRMHCLGGALMSEDCTLSRHCDETVAGPECVANLCAPDTVRCNGDRTLVLTCDSRGAMESGTPCPRGCTTGGCRPETACSATIFATMSSGTLRIDLCGAGTDQAHTAACAYDPQSVPGEDVLIRLEVDRTRPIRFEARRVATSGEPVDPTLYLRSSCEDMSSEIWCFEDTAGQDEDFTVTVDPGDHFLVIDRHERVGSTCGLLDVTITPM